MVVSGYVGAGGESTSHVLVASPPPPHNIVPVVVGDRGLCSAWARNRGACFEYVVWSAQLKNRRAYVPI